jgi:hypothetical protein
VEAGESRGGGKAVQVGDAVEDRELARAVGLIEYMDARGV